MKNQVVDGDQEHSHFFFNSFSKRNNALSQKFVLKKEKEKKIHKNFETQGRMQSCTEKNVRNIKYCREFFKL